MNDLEKEYELLTLESAVNSQGEPDIDYVRWLEELVTSDREKAADNGKA